MLTLIVLAGVAALILWQAFGGEPIWKSAKKNDEPPAVTSPKSHKTGTQKIAPDNIIQNASLGFSHKKNRS